VIETNPYKIYYLSISFTHLRKGSLKYCKKKKKNNQVQICLKYTIPHFLFCLFVYVTNFINITFKLFIYSIFWSLLFYYQA